MLLRVAPILGMAGYADAGDAIALAMPVIGRPQSAVMRYRPAPGYPLDIAHARERAVRCAPGHVDNWSARGSAELDNWNVMLLS